MALFGRKNKKEGNAPCCCGGNFNAESMAQAEQAKTEGADIKILGSGCAKCNTLEDNTVEALKMLGKEMPVGHVTDFSKIAAYGVMTTPALVYDQKVLIAGRVAKAEEIAELLKEVMA